MQLPIVTCPECGTHSVRRRHPLVTGWRRGFKIRQAIWSLVGQIAIALLLAIGISGFGRQIASQTLRDDATLFTVIIDAFQVNAQPGYYYFNIGPWQAAGWLLASVVAGLWLGAAFPHWKRWALLIAWALCLLLAISVEYIATGITRTIQWLVGDVPNWRADSIWCIRVTLASFIITLAALPLGIPVRRLWRIAQRRRWRKRLDRTRRARSGE